MENGFYFIVEKIGLIRNIKLIYKFMTPLPGQQTITIHILLTTSQSNE